MNFVVYDLILLVIFIILVSFFLYRNKTGLKREGWLYLYRTKWGMNLIDKIGKKYQKTLKVLSYISITIGYALMGCMLYLFGKLVYIYIAYPSVVREIKVPPIMPLIPYLPQAFKLDYLPPFYFTYWILIIAIIAITHEFAHGIFMRRFGIKIKSTGFGFFPFFLPIFLAAFVEQDEKSMKKSKTFSQMAVLSAGTFANILTAILFFVVLAFFFTTSYAPSGVVFDNYGYNIVGLSTITAVNGINLTSPTFEKLENLMNEEGLNNISSQGKNYVIGKEDFITQESTSKNGVALYYDSPAVNSGLNGKINSINGIDVNSVDELGNEISKYSPGEKVIVEAENSDGKIQKYYLTLDESPENLSKSWLGISFSQQKSTGIMGKVYSLISLFKEPHVYYAAKYPLAEFIYDLLWWIILISLSVALVNMLPMGIFDGGMFFYLTIFGITKNHGKAKKWFAGITYFLLGLVLLLMILWGISFIR